MKILIVLFAVLCAYEASAGSLAKPDTRASVSAKAQFSNCISQLPITVAVGNQSLTVASTLLIFTQSPWAIGLILQQQANMVQLSIQSVLFQGSLNTLVITQINAAILSSAMQSIISMMNVAVNAVSVVNSTQAQQIISMQTAIIQNFTTITTSINSMTINIFQTYSNGMSDATFQMLSATFQSVGTVMSQCATVFVQSIQQNSLISAAMDIVVSLFKSTAIQAYQTLVSQMMSSTITTVQQTYVTLTQALQISITLTQSTVTQLINQTTASFTLIINQYQAIANFNFTIITQAIQVVTIELTEFMTEVIVNVTEVTTVTINETTEMSGETNLTQLISSLVIQMTGNISISIIGIQTQMCTTTAVGGMMMAHLNGTTQIANCKAQGKADYDNDMMAAMTIVEQCLANTTTNLTQCAMPKPAGDSNKSGEAQSCTDANHDKNYTNCKQLHNQIMDEHREGGVKIQKLKDCKKKVTDENSVVIMSWMTYFTQCNGH